MKKNKIFNLYSLFMVVALFINGTTLNTAEETNDIIKYHPSEYKNTCFLPYKWDEKGNTWVLLGLEKRTSGYVWFDFCGKKNRKDSDSWQTALREASEETAGQLQFREGPALTDKQHDTVHYIARIQNIDPYFIEQAAEQLHARNKGKHIEKTEWRWVKLDDFINGTSELSIYWLLNKKLKNPIIASFLEYLIKIGKSN
ncbi:MAG: NUDIX hydrolase [Candidatus Babeliales bacterium]